MNFSTINNSEREYFEKDFSQVNELINRIRQSLISGEKVITGDLNLNEIINFDKSLTFIYITLFQAGEKHLRWGSLRENLEDTINRNIQQIRKNPKFENFTPADKNKCRIMIEYITEEFPVKIEDIQTEQFTPSRFEPGVTGIKLVFEKNLYVYMPTESYIQSQMSLNQALNSIIRKTDIKNRTNKISERIALLKQSQYECSIIKSRAFITYKNEIIPLYRGNPLNKYSPEAIKDIALDGIEWIYKYQKENGQFLYYYDAKEDNYTDHEHPTRTEDNLYYNDLRHCGAITALIRAYQLTGDKKYLECSKKAIDYIISITKEHKVNNENCAYVFINRKSKLGGTGLIAIAIMKYREETGDKSYDEYLKKYIRHLLSRINESGEMYGYYIHPLVQDGNPLINVTEEERRQLFSFYYPGEALLGLALFANHFKEDDELTTKVIEKSKIALDWLVDERPKIYADMFTALPSDGWLMQAIEEWVTNPEFRKDSYINFVFNDAKTMMKNMYQQDDSPYLDYEGGNYYTYGDHYYPDGARAEGLIGACYLAKKLGETELSQEILTACQKAAQAQMLLYISDKNNYAHKNPEKSKGGIRFKATRQWVRVDTIQHVACFYLRLYFAEKGIVVK